jgi:RNAse (barnase) inhibitor barstar
MKQFVIDGNDFSDEDGFRQAAYHVLCPQYELTSRPGLNLDAFNDILRGGFLVFGYEEPIQFTWKNVEKSKTALGYDATLKYYERIRLHAHPSNLKKIDGHIEDAKRHEGPTLFDLIVETIEQHRHINFVES